MLSANVGILISFLMGNYCEYGTTPKVVIGVTVLCLVSLYFFPETPTFLMKQSKISVRFIKSRIEYLYLFLYKTL